MTAQHGDVARGDGWELRCGPYQTVLADVPDDATVITDPPYSDKTHDKQNAEGSDGADRRELNYAAFGDKDLATFAERWHRVLGWTVIMSDNALTIPWADEMEHYERTVFQPLPCVIRGMTVRRSGDGPSSWAIYANVSRPVALHKWGTLPGAYASKPGERVHIGGKPLSLVQSLVRDYSRKGDLIVDPCAGAASHLLAAVIEGRRAIGAEIDPETYEIAVKRLRAGYTPGFDFS